MLANSAKFGDSSNQGTGATGVIQNSLKHGSLSRPNPATPYHVERDDRSIVENTYQSITADASLRHLSVEELRLVDTKGYVPLQPRLWHSYNQPSSLFASPFGNAQQSSTGFKGTFGASPENKPKPAFDLFANAPPTRLATVTSSNCFGAPPANNSKGQGNASRNIPATPIQEAPKLVGLFAIPQQIATSGAATNPSGVPSGNPPSEGLFAKAALFSPNIQQVNQVPSAFGPMSSINKLTQKPVPDNFIANQVLPPTSQQSFHTPQFGQPSPLGSGRKPVLTCQFPDLPFCSAPSKPVFSFGCVNGVQKIRNLGILGADVIKFGVDKMDGYESSSFIVHESLLSQFWPTYLSLTKHELLTKDGKDEEVMDVPALNSYLFGVLVNWLYTGSLKAHAGRQISNKASSSLFEGIEMSIPTLQHNELIALYCFAFNDSAMPLLQDDIITEIVARHNAVAKMISRSDVEFALSRLPADSALGRFIANTWGAEASELEIEELLDANIPDATKAKFAIMAWRASKESSRWKVGRISECEYHNHVYHKDAIKRTHKVLYNSAKEPRSQIGSGKPDSVPKSTPASEAPSKKTPKQKTSAKSSANNTDCSTQDDNI